MLEAIKQKLAQGERLGREDATELFRTSDIYTLGQLAAARRAERHGADVYFGVTLNLNPTNICELRCPLCAFSRDREDPDAYFMTVEQIEEVLLRYRDAGLNEVHIVGGLYPRANLAYYTDVLDVVRRVYPRIAVHGFTAVEIAYLAEREGFSAQDVLKTLRDHGLDGLPGGGAEIFAPRVRERIAPRKLPAEAYLAIHRAAHAMGMQTNMTMLYGHVETIGERVDHLLAIRALQDETGGVTAFVPLPFHTHNTELSVPAVGGITDLRVIAVARLLLDNVPHVRCLWNYYGIKMAQVGICFGADDLGSTALDEKIGRAAGADPDEEHSLDLLSRAVRELGLTPVVTDSFYGER